MKSEDKGKGKAPERRANVTEIEPGESSRSPANSSTHLGRVMQWKTGDEKRAERRRLRMLSDGHRQGCECELCQGMVPVQKSLREEIDES